MRLKNSIESAAVAIVLSICLTTPVLADDVTISTTGEGSSQSVTIDNSSVAHQTSKNDVTSINVSSQSASSGSVDISDSTDTNDPAGSGSVHNESMATTTVSITNGVVTTPETPGTSDGSGGPGAGGNIGSGQSGSVNGDSTTSTAIGGRGGSVLGTATGGFGSGAGLLPEVGAAFPVDVSSLRDWQSNNTAATKLADKTAAWSIAMLLIAASLGAVGGVVNYVHSKRQTRAS